MPVVLTSTLRGFRERHQQLGRGCVTMPTLRASAARRMPAKWLPNSLRALCYRSA